MAKEYESNPYFKWGLVNPERILYPSNLSDDYSDTVSTSYLNSTFNDRLTPRELVTKYAWLANKGKDFSYPGNSYDYNLNGFVRHNLANQQNSAIGGNGHLDDSGKKWNHPTPSTGALISDERMLGLARPTGEVGQWVDLDLNKPDVRNYYRSLSPEGQRLVRQMARDGAIGGYITGRANMYGNKALQRYFDKREEGNILLDPKREESNQVLNSFSNYDYLKGNQMVDRLKKTDLPVEQPIVDPIDFATGGLAGLRGVAVNSFKGIPWQTVARAVARGGVRNAAEGYALDAIGSEALKTADDAYDTYRAYQGARRIPHIRIR